MATNDIKMRLTKYKMAVIQAKINVVKAYVYSAYHCDMERMCPVLSKLDKEACEAIIWLEDYFKID